MPLGLGAAFILRFDHILLQQRLRNLETCAYYLVALNQVAPVFLDLLATPLHAVDGLLDDSRWQTQSRLTKARQVFGLALLLPVVKCGLLLTEALGDLLLTSPPPIPSIQC